MTLPFSDPVLIFASVMVLILLAPLLARAARLPGIVGLILAGMIVGPHGLGILARDQTVELLGSVGLLFIMFIAGLEIDLNQVRRNKSHTIVFGLITFTIPLILGIALGVGVFGMGLMVAVLLATMFSSHTLVTYPLMGKLGIGKNRAVTTTIGGTIITDTLALLILAVIASAVRGDNLSAAFWIREFVLIGLYVPGVLLLLPLLGRWFFRKIDVDENVEFVFVVAVTFLVAYLAHPAGLEPIIGAFLAGLTFNALIPQNSLLMSRIEFTGNAIFIPFFLLSVGMLVDLRLLFTGTEAWVISAGMIGVALLSKYLAALVSQVLLKYHRDEGMLMFGLSVNQAAATLAAVLIGHNIGLFSETVITGTIMMIAVTCLVGSVVTERAGRRVALQSDRASLEGSWAPHRILIPLKEKTGEKDLLDISFMLREKNSHEPLYPLCVVQEARNTNEAIAAAEKLLDHAVVRSLAAGAPVMPVTRVDINAVSGILRTVKDYRISMILFGWDGRPGLRTRVFGRNIDSVIERSTQMVMVSRIVGPINTATRIVALLPPLSEREIGFNDSVKALKTLANQDGTSLLMLCADETIDSIKEFVETLRPAVPVRFERYTNWKNCLEDLRSQVQQTDWLVLIKSRKGEIAWQPFVDRLPAQITRIFPRHNFAAFVTTTGRERDLSLSEDQMEACAVFLPEHIVLAMDTQTIDEALHIILERSFGDSSPDAMAIKQTLVQLAHDQPVELAEHTLFLHTYVAHVTQSVALLGVSRHPLDIELSLGKARIIIVLLDPLGQEPTRHLQALAGIARYVLQPGITGQLCTAESIDQLCLRPGLSPDPAL